MGLSHLIKLSKGNMSTKPFIPWMGGKRRLAKKIIPNIPDHTCYVEPFAGAAAIFFMKNQSKVEVINDTNGELINLYRIIQNHLDEFIKHFKWLLVSRETFNVLKNTDTKTLTDIQRAIRFYYLQKTAFGALPSHDSYGVSTTTPPRLNLLRIEEDLSNAHLRLSRVNIENLHWSKCIDRYDKSHTFFYLDPPYYDTAEYGIKFDVLNYNLIANYMLNAQGKIILSINDHEMIREIFKQFRVETIPISYTLNKVKNLKARELLIYNW